MSVDHFMSTTGVHTVFTHYCYVHVSSFHITTAEENVNFPAKINSAVGLLLDDSFNFCLMRSLGEHS